MTETTDPTAVNGAQALIRTLVACGVDTCFTNPGTSEMHFVAALDAVAEMRGVLGLFEGVVTGAADGYARMAGRPAATLLHLGPGLGNGLANLHNARKGHVPVVNIVGDHATYHKRYDAQLESDIETVARNVSTWIRRSDATADVGRDAADGVAAAVGPPGGVATLILPARQAPRRARSRPTPTSSTRSPRRCAPASPWASSSAAPRCAKRAWWQPAASPTPRAPGWWRRRSRPGSSEAPASRPSTGWRTSPSSPAPNSTGSATWWSSMPRPR
jgi:thiamine pyrophosphate-dependent acetolactate synthase large subunit-like protein